MEHPHIRGLSEWRPLARGGRAAVWEARQLSLGRLVAVKVYQSDLDEGGRRRFLREAAAVGRLSNHPGVVTLHDAGTLADDRPYLIMELYPGGSLARWLKPANRPSEAEVRQVGLQIADALAAVHARDVLHRDVKPANILIDRFGNPALADFGLAVMASADAAVTDGLGMTPAYAPPEAFETLPATKAGDVFSLAATLYALMAGSAPRSVNCTGLEQMIEAANKPIGPIPWVSWCLMDVLMTGLSNDPAARPTAACFRDQLAQVPVAQISRRELHVGVADDASPLPPPRSLAVPVRSTSSNGHSIAVAVRTADAHPVTAQVATLEPQRRQRRRAGVLAVAASLITVIASVTAWSITKPEAPAAFPAIVNSATPGGMPSSSASPPATDATPPTRSGTRPGSAEAIQVQIADVAAKPFQTVLIRGTYRGAADTLLRMQLWEGGKWLALPLPTKTTQTGQFTAYVELGRPGRYLLRVLDPDSGTTSKPSELVIVG